MMKIQPFKYSQGQFLVRKINFKKPFQYVWSYLSAKFGPRVSLDIFINRLIVCKYCSWNIQKDTRNYCRACFCPETKFWPDAELRNKCGMKNVECPRKKWPEISP